MRHDFAVRPPGSLGVDPLGANARLGPFLQSRQGGGEVGQLGSAYRRASRAAPPKPAEPQHRTPADRAASAKAAEYRAIWICGYHRGANWQGIVTIDERARAIDLARQLKLTVGEIARMGKFVRLSHV
jgi:hypothetical protein